MTLIKKYGIARIARMGEVQQIGGGIEVT